MTTKAAFFSIFQALPENSRKRGVFARGPLFKNDEKRITDEKRHFRAGNEKKIESASKIPEKSRFLRYKLYAKFGK